MAKRHSVRKLQFMKAIIDVHSFFQEESLKIKNNQPILPHTALLDFVCAALKISKNTVRRTVKECETCNSPGKKVHSFHWALL
jgi:hypothetical protein